MNKIKLQLYFSRILPYISMGVGIVLFILGIIFFSYVLIIGAIIGLILFVVGTIRARFFNHEKINIEIIHSKSASKKGRIIEHEKDCDGSESPSHRDI